MRPVVVLPTYREAANIGDALTRVRAAAPTAHLLVVDDEGGDGTADIATEAGRRLGRVDVLRRRQREGFGAACRLGYRWALDQGFDVVVAMDADLSHDPACIPDLLAAVEAGAALAIGSRYVDGGSIGDWGAHRRALSRLGNRYASAMLRVPASDLTSGFRAYRADVLSAIDPDGVRADGYGFLIEMAYRVHRAGGAIVERPIHFVDRVHGRSKMSPAIVVEALALVTAWAVRDALIPSRRRVAVRA